MFNQIFLPIPHPRARNTYNAEFGERVAFVVASRSLHGLAADRYDDGEQHQVKVLLGAVGATR